MKYMDRLVLMSVSHSLKGCTIASGVVANISDPIVIVTPRSTNCTFYTKALVAISWGAQGLIVVDYPVCGCHGVL